MTKVQLIERIKAIRPQERYGILWTASKSYLEQKLEVLEEYYGDNNSNEQ